MKKLILTLLSLVFILSYVNLSFVEANMDISNIEIEVNEYVENIKKIVTLEPIYDMVPVEYHEKIDEVVDKVSKDEKINDIIETQSQNTMNDLINGTNSFNQQAITNQMMDVFEDYAAEVEAATGHVVPTEYIRTEFEKRIVGYDLSTQYEKVLSKVDSKLSPKHKELLGYINYFTSNVKLFKTIVLIGLGVSLGLLGIFSLKSFLSLSILGLILLGVNQYGYKLVIPKVLAKLPVSLESMKLHYEIFTFAYIAMGILFGLGLVGMFINRREMDENNSFS